MHRAGHLWAREPFVPWGRLLILAPLFAFHGLRQQQVSRDAIFSSTTGGSSLGASCFADSPVRCSSLGTSSLAFKRLGPAAVLPSTGALALDLPQPMTA